VAQETQDSVVKLAAPLSVGVILAALGKLNVIALKYLVVHLNTLRTSIEFEILSPNPFRLLSLKHFSSARGIRCDKALPCPTGL
jgi:hypothetical protein